MSIDLALAIYVSTIVVGFCIGYGVPMGLLMLVLRSRRRQ